LRIPDLRARDDSPLRRSCHHVGPASCRTRRLRAQRIRRCGLNATFRTRLQRCDGDWWPLSLRHSRVAHAAPLGTNTEICDTVRLEHLQDVGLAGHVFLRHPSCDWTGRISKCGDAMLRSYLFEAAGVLLTQELVPTFLIR